MKGNLKVRQILLISFILSLCIISGCLLSSDSTELKKSDVEKVNTLEQVVLEIVESTVTPEGLTLRIVNGSDKAIGYNGAFSLEETIDGEWYVVNDVLGGKFEFADVGLGTAPKSTTDIPIDWRGIYGELDSGDYRILFNVVDEFDSHDLAAEYHISD